MRKIAYISLLLSLTFNTAACQSILQENESIKLASSTESSVEVTIFLLRDKNNQTALIATFAPIDPTLHLYSKDIPKAGVDGLGRPTLLEVAGDSTLKAIGGLAENIAAQQSKLDPQGLLFYPAGPVTLTLPFALSDANKHTEKVFVTYMACNQQGCRAPVENKAIEISIPSQ